MAWGRISSYPSVASRAKHPTRPSTAAANRRVVERPGQVAGGVVEGIAVEGRVGDHEGPVALPPERRVVAPADARDPAEGGAGLERQVAGGAEGGRRSPHRRARAQVADEAEEVAAVRVEPAEQRRVALAAGPVVVVAQHLERDHERDPLAARPGRPGVDDAALWSVKKKGGSSLVKATKRTVTLGRERGEGARQLEERRPRRWRCRRRPGCRAPCRSARRSAGSRRAGPAG